MRLIEVEVDNFRSIVRPLRVQLTPGLNVVHGPNEIGKSTLLDAIWCALTVSSRGKTAVHRAMRSTTVGAGDPRVRLRFEHAGAEYELTKVFKAGTQHHTQLRRFAASGAVSQSGEPAETELRQLIQVKEPGRSGVLADADAGIWPLLRVAQGEQTRSPSTALGNDLRENLHQQLARLSGEILCGPTEQRLLQRVRDQFEKYFTPAGNPISQQGNPWEQARRGLAEARQTLVELEQQQRAHEQLIDRAAWLVERSVDLEQQGPDKQQRLARAQQASDQLANLQRALATQQQQLALAERDRQQQAERIERRQERRADLARANAQSAGLSEQIAALAAHQQPLTHQLQQAELGLVDSEQRLTAARQRVELWRLERDLAQAQQRQAAIDGALAAAGAAEQARIAAQAALARNLVDERARKRLHQLADAVSGQRIRLETAAASVQVTALAPIAVQLADRRQQLATGETLQQRAVAALDLRIGDVARVVVTPGSDQSLEQLRATLAEQEQQLERELRAHGATTLDEADRSADGRRDAEQQLAAAQQRLQDRAPAGLAALQQQASQLAAQRQALVEARSQLLASSGLATVVAGDAADDDSALDQALRAAERAATAAQDQREHARNQVAALREQIAVAASRIEQLAGHQRALDEQQRRAQQSLADEVAAQGDDPALAAALLAADAQLVRLQRDAQQLAQQIAAGHPEQIEAELAAAQRALSGLQAELTDVRREQASVDGELRAGQAEGLAERRQAAAAAVERATELLAAFDRRAAAARLLHETLERRRAASQQRYLAPLVAAVQPWLQLVFPDAQLGFDEQFQLGQLSRAAGSHDFEQLSSGAREQLAMIVRLALGRLLANGRGTPVFLDDALAVSDDRRLQRLAQVLDLASRELQIVLVTSRWSALQRLGLAPQQVIDLEALR